MELKVGDYVIVSNPEITVKYTKGTVGRIKRISERINWPYSIKIIRNWRYNKGNMRIFNSSELTKLKKEEVLPYLI